VDIRLTAPDGYQSERSYSIASPPEDDLLTLTVERVPDGEVSPYLVDELRGGDQFELRGPIGGHFVWSTALRGPLYVVAGGSGIVPLMAMLRHRERHPPRMPATLIYSSRTLADIIFRDELAAMAARDTSLRVINTLTREKPPDWDGRYGRVNRALLEETAFPTPQNPMMFICGPSSFVEDAARHLVELGHDPEAIKTERFGPSAPPA
jgi:ferredoxin-NADP reductase